ncbi:MAG: hypothetical protein NTY07_07325 [Bacteroidia bacterium]|nr:hypothetical protein [Bacteroidia bacterium]
MGNIYLAINAVYSANFLVFLCGLVTLWQEKKATKTQKHKVSRRKQKKQKTLNCQV